MYMFCFYDTTVSETIFPGIEVVYDLEIANINQDRKLIYQLEQ